MGSDKNWAAEYLIDPLHEPTPADLDGPGTHFRPPVASQSKAGSDVHEQYTGSTAYSKASPSVTVTEQSTGSSTNPFRKGYISPNGTAQSPKAAQRPSAALNPFVEESPHRRHRSTDGRPPRRSEDSSSPGKTPRRRTNSLRERYPGDRSNSPLDTIRSEERRAHRSPHLKKRHIPGADSIDKLDLSGGGAYHHESAYDAATLARNSSYTSSPVAALDHSTKEALKATPRENIEDSVTKHRPLEGTAIVPPGEVDRLGRRYEYQEGDNLMITHGGDYKRWPGVTYHPDDIKGKGEPSYSIEKSLKEHKAHAAKYNGEGESVELAERPRHRSSSGADLHEDDDEDAGEGHSRISSVGHRLSGEMRRRIGSLRRKDKQSASATT